MYRDEMTCESGLDDTHQMPVAGAIYVFTIEGAREDRTVDVPDEAAP